MTGDNALIRRLDGRPWGYLDGDAVKDPNGKPIATREVGEEATSLRLADKAGAWMTGRKVLLDLAPADIATASTEADFGIPRGDFVGDQISYPMPVKHDRGIWYQENATDATQQLLGESPADGSPAEANPNYTSVSFTTKPYGLVAKLPRHVVSNADFDLKARAARFLVEQLRLHREVRLARLLTTSANWAAGNVVAAAASWNASGGANTLADLFSAAAVSQLPVDTMILPEVADQYFRQTTVAGSVSIRDFMQSGGSLPAWPLIAKARYQTGGAQQYVWAPSRPANVALVRTIYREKWVGKGDDYHMDGWELKDPETDTASCMTFRWLGDPNRDAGARREGMLVRSFFEPRTDSWCVIVSHNDSDVMPLNTVGALITGALT